MFYSPKYKFLVNKQRKRRKFEQTQALIPSNASFELVWKYPQADPIRDTNRLLQFSEAYATDSIEKYLELQQIIKYKDEIIIQLEQGQENEQQIIEQQW